MSLAGSVLDKKWRIQTELGRGGTGVVYAAIHERNQLPVAVKVLHSELARDEGLRQRFLHEGYAANRVGHPSTVQIMDDGLTPDGIPYLVMERLDGKSLERLADMRGGSLPVEEALRYTLQWLEVIAAAHDKGIVHRDLKPENVQVIQGGAIKVLDFGIAHIREVSQKARLTVTGDPMGTPAFMPPEQALAYWDEVDARSDVFAIGASFFTLVSGQLVHEGSSVNEIIVRASTRPAAPVQSVAPKVPPPVARVIDRALSFQKEARYANAREMLVALRAAVEEVQHTTGRTFALLPTPASGPIDPTSLSVSATSPVSAAARTSNKGSPAVGLIALACLVAAAVAGLGIFLLSRSRPASTATETSLETTHTVATAVASYVIAPPTVSSDEPPSTAAEGSQHDPSALPLGALSASGTASAKRGAAPTRRSHPSSTRRCRRDPYKLTTVCD